MSFVCLFNQLDNSRRLSQQINSDFIGTCYSKCSVCRVSDGSFCRFSNFAGRIIVKEPNIKRTEEGITIKEAKERLSIEYAIPEDSIEIILKG